VAVAAAGVLAMPQAMAGDVMPRMPLLDSKQHGSLLPRLLFFTGTSCS
jgi:hypothetical protein